MCMRASFIINCLQNFNSHSSSFIAYCYNLKHLKYAKKFLQGFDAILILSCHLKLPAYVILILSYPF